MPDEPEPNETSRPKGRLAATHSGTDEVTAPEPARQRAPARRRFARSEPEAADAHDDTSTPAGASVDELDERDRRQSPNRKAAGPKGRRLRENDVVIDGLADQAEPPPTEPA